MKFLCLAIGIVFLVVNCDATVIRHSRQIVDCGLPNASRKTTEATTAATGTPGTQTSNGFTGTTPASSTGGPGSGSVAVWIIVPVVIVLLLVGVGIAGYIYREEVIAYYNAFYNAHFNGPDSGAQVPQVPQDSVKKADQDDYEV